MFLVTLAITLRRVSYRNAMSNNCIEVEGERVREREREKERERERERELTYEKI